MPAAVTDPYATEVEYKARVDKTGTGDDALLLVQLTSVSRWLDKELRRFFTKDAAAITRVFDGNGELRLWLPDIATSTGLVVKADLDGDYVFTDETALTLDTDFWLGPPNADKGPEPRPWEYIEVSPNSTQLSCWPLQQRSIQIAACWGWPAVPGIVKELTCYITRDWRDRQQAGASQTLEIGGMGVRISSETFLMLQDVKRMYGLPQPF
jgi:hypothetical protein